MFSNLPKQAAPVLQKAKNGFLHLCSKDASAAEISAAATAVSALLFTVNYLSSAGYLSTGLAALSTITFGVSAMQQGVFNGGINRLFNQPSSKPMAMTDTTAPTNGPKKVG